MAVDSERKRKSIVAIGFLVVGPVVVADGSFDQGDRQTSGYGYFGINAGEVSYAEYILVQSAFIERPSATAIIRNPYATATMVSS